MWLRPGTLLDLTIIARGITSYTLADELGLSTGSISNYVLASRNIKQGTINDIAQRWAKCIKPIIPEFTPTISEFGTTEDYLVDVFRSAYYQENSLRLLVEDEVWLTGFGCCAAQVLAPWSESLTFEKFSADEARNLIEALLTNRNKQGLDLALKYILWRIKTREGYYIKRIPFKYQDMETKDMWPIPYFKRETIQGNLLQNLESVPLLKKASTIDVLALCDFVSLGIANNQQHLPGILLDNPAFTCSCYLKDDEVKFLIQKP